MRRLTTVARTAVLLALFPLACSPARHDPPSPEAIDQQVSAFLESSQQAWRDMNIPEADARILFDLIVESGYERALEIGTSTGYSAVWMAWALSKNNGSLVTIEIDEGRYREALQNFEKAGLSAYVDARLADAHELVPNLEGPFDFVFVDADKDWYSRYFLDLLPKINPGGCFVAHNVSNQLRGISEFLDTIANTPGVETRFVHESGSGLSVTCKRSE